MFSDENASADHVAAGKFPANCGLIISGAVIIPTRCWMLTRQGYFGSVCHGYLTLAKRKTCI